MKTTLEDRRERLLAKIRNNDELINDSPRGGLRIKKINGRCYYYLQFRKGKQVKSEYLGPVGGCNVAAIKSAVARRRSAEDENRRLKAELKNVEKALRAIKSK